VNYSEDIRLTEVLFVTPEVGYVGGIASTILKTTDGGKSWALQMGGDPQDTSRWEVKKFRFLDENTGFAALKNSVLLGTTDGGETWNEVGSLVTYFSDYDFSTPMTGATAYGQNFYYTRDGGATWTINDQCVGTAEIDGLNRKFGCNIERIQFVSPQVGYALGSPSGAYAAVILRTDDGGESWDTVSTLVGPSGSIGGFVFTDENNGVFSSQYNLFKAYRTTDGGKTWTVIPATKLSNAIKFADPEVGWSFANLCVGMGCTNAKLDYTVDGGKKWSTRDFPFPAGVVQFSLPRRDVGYAVGEHGMIYRYRLVNAAEPVHPKAIPAMVVPPLANGVVQQIDQLDTRLDKLEAALKKAQPAGGASNGSNGETWVAEAGLTQQVEQLATAVEGIASEAPELGRRYRNANIVMLGLKLLSDLTGQGSGLKEALASLRQAKDAAAASAALESLHGQLDAMKTSVEAFKTSK
jgi:photosystem II stability/assembly factor-like uncharacterized protein